MNVYSFKTLAIAIVLTLPASLLPSSAVAQDLCDPNGALMQGAKQAQQERVKELEEHARNVYGPMAESPEWISDAESLLANCVADQFGDWKVSSGSSLFNSITNKAKDKAIDKACAEQRKRVAEYAKEAKGYLSRIKGYENIGSQKIQLPGGVGSISYDDLIGNIGGQIPDLGNLNPINGGTIPGIGGTGNSGSIPGVGGGGTTQSIRDSSDLGIPGIR